MSRLSALILFLLGLTMGFLLGLGTAASAHADMCGPSGLPGLTYLNPYIKGCQAYLPGAGNLPQIPVPQSPANAPYPVYVPPWGSWVRP